VIRLLLLAAMLLTGCAVTIRNDSGGMVVDYAIKARKAKAVRFDGKCMSACTLYLTSANTCITPRASFWFHHPYGGTPEQNATAARHMMAAYPLWVRDWINARGGLTSNWLVIDYGTAVQFMRKC
jgi:hypothetical protein